MHKDGVKTDLDLTVNVISEADNDTFIGQYINFCNAFDKIKADKNLTTKEIIDKTVDYCIKQGILVNYLKRKESEVKDMMAHLIDQQEWIDYSTVRQ